MSRSARNALPSTPDVAAGLIRTFSKPSTSFSSHEHDRMAKLCEVVKAFLRADMAAFVCAHHSDALLFFYSADATPMSTKEIYEKSMGVHKVRRKGRAMKELLVQRLFALAGNGHCKVLLDEPRPMADKTAWTHTGLQGSLRLPQSTGP